MRHWLMKTEPGTFSIEDLRRAPDGTAPWDGVRNYQARNHMRDGMRAGDPVLIYHSSTAERAIVGSARVAHAAYPDHTAWDPRSGHYDPRSSPEIPVWIMVDVSFVETFPRPLTLEALRGIPELSGMMLLRRGMRLSVQPVMPAEFETVLAYGRGERPLPEAPPPPAIARPAAGKARARSAAPLRAKAKGKGAAKGMGKVQPEGKRSAR